MPDYSAYSLDSFSSLNLLKGTQISKAIKISFQEQQQLEPLFHTAL